ncbi:hypothetical protein K0M31_020170, partial [Melipona bicolor]
MATIGHTMASTPASSSIGLARTSLRSGREREALGVDAESKEKRSNRSSRRM